MWPHLISPLLEFAEKCSFLNIPINVDIIVADMIIKIFMTMLILKNKEEVR